MTKKDYEAIAEILDANVADLGIVFDFADMLEEDNPRFDRKRFIDASTVQMLDSNERTLRLIEIASRPRKEAKNA